MKKPSLVAAAAIAAALCVLTSGGVDAAPLQLDRSATSPYGMVAAANPLAARAGVEMLEKGGNAVDAAVAVAFALTVVEPFGSSIGGDGIALVYTATNKSVEGFEYRAAAPRAGTTTVYDYNTTNSWLYTGMGCAVPGMVAGTCSMHEEYGLLPLSVVMEPAIRYAEEGYTVGPTLAKVISDGYNLLAAKGNMSAAFLVDELPADPGMVLKNADLGKSLRMIAAEGADTFYHGQLADMLIKGIVAEGGVMTREDLASYKPARAKALSIEYNGYTIHSAPLPFGGLGVLLNMNLIERLPFSNVLSASDPYNLHLMAEAMKLGAKDRYQVSGDPRFVKVPVDWLLSDDYADLRVLDIDVRKARPIPDVPAGPVDKDPGSTTHLTVVDSQGNAVSLTQTLGGYFGCGIMPAGTGIVMNDQMKNFSSRRSSPNNLQPGKRMNSTQSPTIVTKDGELLLAVGSPGNYRIITTVTQMLVNILDFQMPLQEAINAPRICSGHQLDALILEGHFPATTVQRLKALGHVTDNRGAYDMFFGGVHAIIRDQSTGMLTGAADPRRDGLAVGLEAAPAILTGVK